MRNFVIIKRVAMQILECYNITPYPSFLLMCNFYLSTNLPSIFLSASAPSFPLSPRSCSMPLTRSSVFPLNSSMTRFE